MVSTKRGRGVQLNHGWKYAHGEWCLFLHADSVLPPDYVDLLAVARRDYIAQHKRAPEWGCFRSITVKELPAWQSWWLSSGVRLRTVLRHLPYGDQGLLVAKKTLEDLGGLREWPLLEDYDLALRLRGRSPPLIIPWEVQTSGRRWLKLGFWQTFVVNQCVLIGYHLGVDITALAQWYASPILSVRGTG